MIDIKNLKVSKGDYIYKEGDPSDKIYFIKNGDFEISKKMKVEDVQNFKGMEDLNLVQKKKELKQISKKIVLTIIGN